MRNPHTAHFSHNEKDLQNTYRTERTLQNTLHTQLVQKMRIQHTAFSRLTQKICKTTFITELAFNKTYTNKFVKNAQTEIETTLH